MLVQVADLARDRSRIVDGTAGGGGHLQVFVDAGAQVVAFDRDPHVREDLTARFGEIVALHFLSFGSEQALAIIDGFHPDLVFLDLGISSQQIDEIDRGFTFRSGAPLDMRMDGVGATAADILNEAEEGELADIFYQYGDERRSRRLASEVSRRRATQMFVISDDLVNTIRAVLGSRAGPSDFARLFQALRIAVNDELQQLKDGLPRMRDALTPEGSLAVLTYHSGEDRIVKHAFRDWARSCVCPPTHRVCVCRGKALGTVVTKSPVTPGSDELAANPRARSAKMRVFRRA